MTQAAYGWTELRPLVRGYLEQISTEKGKGYFFGYGSLITNNTTIKGTDSLPDAEQKARLDGWDVAMNVYATGPQEFRGTNDSEHGVYNVGLYAGLEPSVRPDGYSEGITIAVPSHDFRRAFEEYAKRELGVPPYPAYFDDLFSEQPLEQLPLIEPEKDGFGLYKLFVGNVRQQEGTEVPSLTVAVNEKSPLAAVGLTTKEAAQYIWDGVGYKRPDGKGGTLGGTALDYFYKNVLSAYRDASGAVHYNNPRIFAIEHALLELGQRHFEAEQAIGHVRALQKLTNNQEIVEHVQALLDTALKALVQPWQGVAYKQFGPGEGMQRPPVAPEVVEEQLAAMPRTPQEKHQRIARVFGELREDPLVQVSLQQQTTIQDTLSPQLASIFEAAQALTPVKAA